MSDFEPSAELKLEGAQVGGPASGDIDLGMVGGYSRPTIGESHGEVLPGAPRASDPQDLRPTEPLVRATTMGRVAPFTDDYCLSLAQQSYVTAEDYFNSADRNRVIDAMARFNSEHPKGSKYHSSAFERRSRLFRPKTRSVVRKREAAAAVALFGSAGIVNVEATAGTTPASLDASIQQSLLNYRLTQDDRWYRLMVGAVQDADRQGFAIVRTGWEYQEASRYYDEMDALGAVSKRVDMVATVDRPDYALVPIERFRFSPAADWMDVIGSSPFLIEVRPMFLCDVRRDEHNPRARLRYRHLSDAELLSGGSTSQWDAVSMQRERNRVSRYSRSSEPNDFAVVWVHRNIVRLQGEDYVFDTVGTTRMLSSVIPLSEFDPRGYRPYVIGSTMIESHNPHNVGAVTLMSGLQDEINDTTNLALDANKMATSGRMFIKRNTAVDLHALARFSPGSVVEMDNPQQDVKWDRPQEAPASMFQEHQVLNVELDDLIGNFAQSSVAQNQNLNKTVGGMEMLGTAADQITEYDLHTFCITLVNKVLLQVLDLEKLWETDANIAAIVGQRMGQNARRFWNSLSTQTKVDVSVGFGATNPQKRMERIGMAMTATTKMYPAAVQQSNQAEVMKEVWAAAGFPNATRFFPLLAEANAPDADPKIIALKRQVQELTAQLAPGAQNAQTLLQREQVKSAGAERIQQLKMQQALAVQAKQAEAAYRIKEGELRMAYIDLQLQHEHNEVARGQLMLNREKLSNDITVQRMELELARTTAMASAEPPEIGVDAKSAAEASELQQPGSNIPASPSFDAENASAADYVREGGMPPPPPPVAAPSDPLVPPPDVAAAPQQLALPTPPAPDLTSGA